MRGRQAGQPCAGRMGVRLRTGAAMAMAGGEEQAEQQNRANGLGQLARRVALAALRGAGCEHVLAIGALRRRSGEGARDILVHFRQEDEDAAQRERERLVESQWLVVEVEGREFRVGAEFYVHEGGFHD